MEAGEKACPFCAETIKVMATVCKHCGKDLTGKTDNNQIPQINVNLAPPPKPKSRILGCIKIFAIFFIALMIIGIIAGRRGRDSGASVTEVATPSTTPNATTAVPQLPNQQQAFIKAKPSTTSNATTAVPQLPNKQQAFIKANTDAIFDFNSKSNEIQQEQARDRRKQAIQNALGETGRIDGWIGTVESIRTSIDGKGILSVRIHPSITISTTPQIFGPSTFIEKSSPLFSIIGNLSEEDVIKFSGSFIPSEKDYVEEDSLTIRGSMTDPEFSFIFSNIEKQ